MTAAEQRWKLMRLCKSDCGSALVEFSLFLPMLLLMLIGVVDLGLATEQKMIVQEAAHAGALYAALSSNTENIQGMQNASKAASAGVANATSVAVLYCSSSATGAKTQGSPGCPASSFEWAQVTTSTSLPALFGYQFGSTSFTSFTLTGFSEIRVR